MVIADCRTGGYISGVLNIFEKNGLLTTRSQEVKINNISKIRRAAKGA